VTRKLVLPGGFICLPSGDPVLCPPHEKAQRETDNTLKQLLFIEELLERGVQCVRESHIIEFHRLAVEDIFPCGGQYRVVSRTAELDGGGVTHEPPEPALVNGLMLEAIDSINDRLRRSRELELGSAERARRAIEAAAYALWRVNWVHPFAGGNGRTARAVCHLILSIDFGRPLPGKPSVPTIILRERDWYIEALRAADAAERDGREDIAAMQALVGSAAVEQLSEAIVAARALLAELKEQAGKS
jgi:Fic family protein